MKYNKLGDYYKISSGGTPSKNKPEYYENGTIPWVKTGDLKEKYVTGQVEMISELGLKNSSARVYPKGTVLLAMYGATIGACSILSTEASCNQACAAFVPNDKILPEYLYIYLCSQKNKFVDSGVGGAQPNISAGFLKTVNFQLETLEKQRRVVEIFDSLDTLVSMHKKQIDKIDFLVKSRFIEMFGLPFGTHKYSIKKLKDISTSISDGSNIDKTYYMKEGEVLFLRIQNVWSNEFRLQDSVYITKEVNSKYFDTSLHKGDLLITKIGRFYTQDSSLGRVSVYLGDNDKANYSNNIMRIRLDNSVLSEYVNSLFNLDDYNKYIRKVSVGGTDKRALSKAIIGDLPVIMAPMELQREYVNFLAQVDKSKLAVQQCL